MIHGIASASDSVLGGGRAMRVVDKYYIGVFSSLVRAKERLSP